MFSFYFWPFIAWCREHPAISAFKGRGEGTEKHQEIFHPRHLELICNWQSHTWQFIFNWKASHASRRPSVYRGQTGTGEIIGTCELTSITILIPEILSWPNATANILLPLPLSLVLLTKINCGLGNQSLVSRRSGLKSKLLKQLSTWFEEDIKDSSKYFGHAVDPRVAKTVKRGEETKIPLWITILLAQRQKAREKIETAGISSLLLPNLPMAWTSSSSLLLLRVLRYVRTARTSAHTVTHNCLYVCVWVPFVRFVQVKSCLLEQRTK